jgi:hypothetical protein
MNTRFLRKVLILISISIMAILFISGPVMAASIFGRVFEDMNCNGVRNGGDGPIAGVQMQLDPGAVLTSTLADGTYSYTGLAAGTYTVKIKVIPAGYCATTPIKLGVNLQSAARTVRNVNFGLSQLDPSPGTSCCP